MEMRHVQSLRMHQRLVMTPKLQQALKLLQVPTLELEQILKQEILMNPLLEEIEPTEEDEEETETSEETIEEAPTDENKDQEEPIDWEARARRFVESAWNASLSVEGYGAALRDAVRFGRARAEQSENTAARRAG